MLPPTGRGGFLWPGLNSPVLKDGARVNMSRRGEAEQQEVHAELGTTAGSEQRQSDFSKYEFPPGIVVIVFCWYFVCHFKSGEKYHQENRHEEAIILLFRDSLQTVFFSLALKTHPDYFLLSNVTAFAHDHIPSLPLPPCHF